MTVIFILPASSLRIDSSGVSFTIDDSEDYTNYRDFIESFGTNDYIILTIQNALGVSDPALLKRINRVHEKLMATGSILNVIDLGTVQSSSVLNILGAPDLQDEKALSNLRKIIPGLTQLISSDFKTLSFIVKIDNEKLNGFQLESQVKRMKKIIETAFPEHPECYSAGIPVLRAAFERYNLMNALVFGTLGFIFGILIAFYIFKTLWAAVMVMLASLGSLIWTLGIMGIFNINLNLATGLSFGFILVVSTTTVFHIVSKYYELLKIHPETIALTKTFETIFRPCFMCALTTSAGFFTLTLSPVPMVHQAGIIISSGVMLAFFLSVLITAFCLPKFATPRTSSQNETTFDKTKIAKTKRVKTKGDFLEKIVKNYTTAGFKYPRISFIIGLLFFIVMASGIIKIQTVKHLTNPVIKSTKEARELAYIEKHVSTGTSFSIILKSKDNSFNTKQFWYDLYQFEKQIKTIPGVRGVDSLTPLIFKAALKLSPAGIMPEFVYRQILKQSSENDMIRTYLDPVSKKLRLVVHIQNQTSNQMEAILGQIKKQAEKTFVKTAEATLTGQLILLRSQTTDFVSSQLKTLFLAFLVITLLMMIQLKSVIFGALSLIPNLFPLVTIFGIMGWFHIPLDPLTIFAAVISFGLSVDDSIHYLTQVKREIVSSKPGQSIHDCMLTAYHKTSRALVSTTAVLFLSSLGLLFSSFSHVFSLGILICSASIIALISDLIFMPGVILTFKPLKKILSEKILETTTK